MAKETRWRATWKKRRVLTPTLLSPLPTLITKVTSIIGLDEEKLDLAQSIEDLSEMNKISILTENGFQITLVERALAGIESTDTGDIDSQRLYMFIVFTSSTMQMTEDFSIIKSTFYINGRVKMDV